MFWQIMTFVKSVIHEFNSHAINFEDPVMQWTNRYTKNKKIKHLRQQKVLRPTNAFAL